MKKYIDPSNDRYQYQVRKTLNGFSVEVLVVPTGDIVGLTSQVAEQLEVTVPDGYRVQSSTREEAEAVLDTVAQANGWTEMK